MEMIGNILRGRYSIVRELGSGGFGTTYLAEDLDLPGNPPCVVKQLKTDFNDPETLQIARRLFTTEAKILQQLGSHPQIPQLFAYFEENQQFYLVQEYIDGHNLSVEITPEKILSESYVKAFLLQVLEPLKFIQQHQVIHRDLKPDNLIRRQDDGKIFLIDFGAVKQITSEIIQTNGQRKPTVAVGTPGYMPPEQFHGHPQFCSDIYALGIIGIEALVGKNANSLPQDDNGNIIWRNQAKVSNELAAILTKMANCQARDRYQSAMEVYNDLNQGTIPTQVTNKPTKTNRKILLLIAAFASLLLIIFLVLFTVNPRNIAVKYKSYSNENLQIKIDRPENWLQANRRDIVTGEVVSFKYRPENGSDSQPIEISIYIKDFNNLSRPLTFNEYQTRILQLHNLTEEDVKINRDVTLANNPARQIIYSLEKNSKQLKQLEIFTLKNNQAYSLIYTAPQYKYNKFLPIANRMIDSFEIE